jgi:hypothetical protein
VEVEPSKVELLDGTRGELDVPLKTVVLVGLDHDDPGMFLQEDRGHPSVGIVPE